MSLKARDTYNKQVCMYYNCLIRIINIM